MVKENIVSKNFRFSQKQKQEPWAYILNFFLALAFHVSHCHPSLIIRDAISIKISNVKLTSTTFVI
jgi:hypothetical protein